MVLTPVLPFRAIRRITGHIKDDSLDRHIGRTGGVGT
jgi:hypothetical protein